LISSTSWTLTSFAPTNKSTPKHSLFTKENEFVYKERNGQVSRRDTITHAANISAHFGPGHNRRVGHFVHILLQIPKLANLSLCFIDILPEELQEYHAQVRKLRSVRVTKGALMSSFGTVGDVASEVYLS